MPLTQDDLRAFQHFVGEKLADGGAESLHALVAEWEERQEVNAAIRRGIADVDAGRTEAHSESQDRFRQEQGLPPRR
jgi:predicted transcriptional regulator